MWLSPRLRYRLRTLTGRSALEEQLAEELQFHLEMQTAAYVAQGVPLPVAELQARRRFGSVLEHQDYYRDRWTHERWAQLWRTVSAAAQALRAQPITSVAIVAALAVGIGVSTAVYTVFHAIAIAPPPYADAGQLVRIQAPRADGERLLSAVEYRELQREVPSLESLAEFHYMYFILLDRQEPLRVAAGVVSTNFFDVIGVQPALGRTFAASDDVAAAPGVLVVSHEFWQRELAGDPRVIGRTFEMNDRTHTVIGVLPPLPAFPEQADIYLPTTACPLRSSEAGTNDRSVHLVSALGRLDDQHRGVDTVRLDLAQTAGRLRADHPTDYAGPEPLALTAVGVNDDLTGRFRPVLSVLLAAAGCLLASLCSSVGALLVAGVQKRRQRISLQVALGAWRGRLFQQFAWESCLLTAAGTVGGLVLAYAGLPSLVALASHYTTRAPEIRLDGASLLFAGALWTAVSMACAAILTMACGRRFLQPVAASDRQVFARPLFRGLVVGQIALSFALLVVGGLTLRSATQLERVDTGFRTQDVVTARLSTDFVRYDSPELRAALYERLLASVRQVPGVTAVALSGALPLHDQGNVGDVYVTAGEVGTGPQAGSARSPTRASLQIVSADYFATLGLRFVAGAPFAPGVGGDGGSVAVINETLAEHLWPHQSAIGEQLDLDSRGSMTIVGVVADGRQRLDQAPMGEVYLPLSSQAPVQARLFVRSSSPTSLVAGTLRSAIRAVEPRQSIDGVQLLDGVREASIVPRRHTAWVIALFAIASVVIASVGVAGVVGAAAAARTQEVGLRLALGATRVRVVGSVLADGLRLAVGGLALGLVCALALSRPARTLLVDSSGPDVVVFGGVAVVLLSIIAAACVLPARRAALVDPNVALKIG